MLGVLGALSGFTVSLFIWGAVATGGWVAGPCEGVQVVPACVWERICVRWPLGGGSQFVGRVFGVFCCILLVVGRRF